MSNLDRRLAVARSLVKGWRASAVAALLALALGLALAPAILDLFAAPQTLTLRSADFRSWGGYAWAAALPPLSHFYEFDSDHDAVTAPTPVVTEDGVVLGPPHSHHDEIRASGYGRHSLWKDSLILSSSDGSDPRDNGRTYRLVAGERVKPAVVDWSLFGAAICLLLAILLRPRSTILAVRGVLATAVARRGEILLAMLPPGIAVLLLAVFVPPVLSTVDSAVFMVEDLDIVPLYGPIYMALIHAVEALSTDARSQIVILQVVQHATTIAGIGWLATAGRGAGRVLLVATLATIGGYFDVFAHGVQADALVVGEAAALLGQFFRIVSRGPSYARLAWFAVLLAVLALTRYHFVILGTMLPIYYGLGVVSRSGSSRGRWREFSQACAASVAGVVLAAILLWTMCLGLGTHPTLNAGRQGSNRMAEAAAMLDEPQRRVWVDGLQSRSQDPFVRRAIDVMCNSTGSWVTAWLVLREDRSFWAVDVDPIEDRAFHVFAFALDDPIVRQQWLHGAATAFAADDGFWSAQMEQFAAAAAVVKTPASQAVYPWLRKAVEPGDAERWAALSTSLQPWFTPLGRYLALKLPIALAIFGMLATMVTRRGAGRVAAALIMTGALSLAAISFSNVMQERHLLPETILVYAALIAFILHQGEDGAAVKPSRGGNS